MYEPFDIDRFIADTCAEIDEELTQFTYLEKAILDMKLARMNRAKLRRDPGKSQADVAGAESCSGG